VRVNEGGMRVLSLFTGVLAPLRFAIHGWVETSLFLRG
jgi:hypothetical protein